MAVAGTIVLLSVVSSPAYASSTDVQSVAAFTAPPNVQQATAEAGCDGWNFRDFGYLGCFNWTSRVMECDWNLDGRPDEAFGISPGRRIYHAWPNSGGWIEMPNNGRADDVHNCYVNGRHQRQVEVRVFTSDPRDGNGFDVWYSYYAFGWVGWTYYPGT